MTAKEKKAAKRIKKKDNSTGLPLKTKQ